MAVEFTVGRHAADDEAGVDPIVAAALQDRPAPGAGTHRSDRPAAAEASADGEGEVGWPGSPRDGEGGLGWPGKVDARARATPAVAPVARRTGWRRLFGGAEQARRSDGAA